MLQKSSLWRVAAIFFNEPTKPFGLLEISKKAKLAHTSVKNHLQTLLKLSIITTAPSQIKNSIIYLAARRSAAFLQYKKLHNLDLIYRSGLVEHIADLLHPDCIVLFGSFMRAEDTSESDIDLFVASKAKDIDLNTYEKALNRKIELHCKPSLQDFPPELRDNIINGVVLYGFLEGYNA